jgi:uncharacterized membrane protein (UPF0136 family)
MNKDKENKGSVWAGIGLGILIHLIPYLLSLAIEQFLFLFYLTPLVHIAAIVYFFVKGKKRTAIGLLILIGIAFLLVAACFGFVMFALRDI